MPVLKQADNQRLAVFSLHDIEQQATDAVAQAKAEAARILQAARDEAEAARQRGFEAGQVEGHAKGHEEGMIEGTLAGKEAAFAEHAQQIQELAETLDQTLRSFEAERGTLEQTAANEVTHLTLALADKVTKRAGTFDPAVCTSNVAAALRMVIRAGDVRLHVNPSDAYHIRQILPEFGRRWPSLKHIELIEDSDITRGGCRVLTAGGLVDADLQTQLDRLAEDLVPSK